MKYQAPFGAADPDDGYVDDNPALDIDGSIPPAKAIEHPQREQHALIVGAGLVPDEADLTQVLQSVLRIAAAYQHMTFMAGWGVDGAGEDLAVQIYGALTAPVDMSIAGVLGNIQAGPVGADLIFDIEVNGVSIFTTKPEIADGFTAVTAGVLTSDPTNFFVSAGDEIVFKILQVGSTTAGQRLTLTIVAGLPEVPA